MITKMRTLLASILGTALEFYDFMLYTVFLEVIGQEYFPGTDGETHFIFGYLTFVAAYVMRPFGATIFGYIGDRWGRRIALILSISLMGIPTFFVGVLPSYKSWGIASSIILVMCRLLQGLCAGGEYNGSAIFALEHVGKKFPGMVGGMITGASVLGVMMAKFVALILKQPLMPTWGWRAAFCGGALVSLAGLYMRLFTSESPEFKKLKRFDRAPLLSAITRDRLSSLTTISIGLLNGTLSYTLFIFMEMYLTTYCQVPPTQALQLSLLGSLVYIISAPLMGLVLDKVGGKRMMMTSCLYVIAVTPLIYFLFQLNTSVSLLTAQVILGLTVACIAGPQHAFVQTMFPVADRYSGISFNYCVGMAIGGAGGPYMMRALTAATGNPYTPAFCVMAVAVLCYLSIRKRSQGTFY